jgi:AhpD family alkylhydroperoxidase
VNYRNLLGEQHFMAEESKKDDSGKWPSYSMVEQRMRRIYFNFYKETYKTSQIDRKNKELIAIAASLGFKCQGCLKGHIEKALQYGATREEISETISVAMGVAAASVVDQTDIISEIMQLRLFD